MKNITASEFVQLADRTSVDNIYAEKTAVKDFVFDEKVVRAFPNMLKRSIPGYWGLVDWLGLLLARKLENGGRIYDLGCSLGAVSWSVLSHGYEPSEIIAVDKSAPMIERFKRNLACLPQSVPIQPICADVRNVDIEDASAVFLNFTLQFVPPADRLAVLKNIRKGLRPGAVFFLSEKIQAEDPESHRRLMDWHHLFKADQGYSELEIKQKAAAISEIMRTERLDTHISRLKSAGFRQITTWWQNFNFVSMIVEA